MKKETVGALVGGGAAVVGIMLISAAAKKSAGSTQTAPDATTRVQEVGGVALLISGIGLALSAGVNTLAKR